jgi:hypothetical protein
VLIFEVLLNATLVFIHGTSATSAAIRRGGGTVCSAIFAPRRGAPHEHLVIGIDRFRDPAELRLDRMPLQPFRNDPADRLHGVSN